MRRRACSSSSVSARDLRWWRTATATTTSATASHITHVGMTPIMPCPGRPAGAVAPTASQRTPPPAATWSITGRRSPCAEAGDRATAAARAGHTRPGVF
ncbi:hypothetical protein GCM10009660_15120 [Catellatospora bangladeshensis]